MSNISFANPYLIFILIPVILIILIPFFITFKKDNIGIRNIFSLILHVIISTLIVLVIAGMSYKTAVEETNIYVVADVSYSTNRNLTTIDEYISQINDNADNKTKVGVVCFGADTPYVLSTPGSRIRSVKTAVDEQRIDQSGTDIAGALRYTASLFDTNVVKRIVLITDGDETTNGNVLNVVNELYIQNVFVDAIYIDDNLPSDVAEVQINSVNYTMSTYKDKAEDFQVSIQSNLSHKTFQIDLYQDGNLINTLNPTSGLARGINVFSIPLDTSKAGTFNYEVKVSVAGDESPHNNVYRFTQTVTENVKILYLASNSNEIEEANKYFKTDNTDVTYLDITKDSIPYTVEALCEYDEYVLSSIDVMQIRNSSQFISNLDLMVSRYAKSLITLGNTYTQNLKEDYEYDVLKGMLPINYGESVRDGRLVTIILDTSKSMRESYHLETAKEAASKLVDLTQETDNIMVVSMYGETQVLQMSAPSTDGTKKTIKDAINNIEERQGTLIGSTLKNTYDLIAEQPFIQKQVYIISDGRNMSADPVDAEETAKEMYKSQGITVSCIGIGSDDGSNLLKTISEAAGGKYYTAKDVSELESLFDNDISGESMKNPVEDVTSSVTVNKNNDATLANIEGDIEEIHGFYRGTTKNSATTILQTTYSTIARDYEVPLYATWRYGNGTVSSFSCDIKVSPWLDKWESGSNGEKFLQNLCLANLPVRREEVPLIVQIEAEGSQSYVYINTPTLNPNAEITLTITNPDGSTLERELVYTTEDYQTNFITDMVGTYNIQISYKLNNVEFSKRYLYDVSYSEEYNSFAYYEISNLNHMVNNGNNVYEDGSSLNMEIDQTKVTTYTYDFTVLFMTISICLFVLDIFIRKVKWADIKNIFHKKN